MARLASWPPRLLGVTLALASLASSSSSSPSPTSLSCDMSKAWDMGGGFVLVVSQTHTQLSILRNDTAIWSTVPDVPFLSASAGNDTIAGIGGNYNLTRVDENKCENINVTKTEHKTWDEGENGHAVIVSGYVYDCGKAAAPYIAQFWVPKSLPDRVGFQVDVDQPSGDGSDPKHPLNELFLSYGCSADEDFYGLGAQASFASLKNQSVPVFSREQGVGRGDQPTTDLQNAFSYFSGGDHFTTYTALPQYISSDARAFHLARDATALAWFDFTEPEVVTVRYGEMQVRGFVMMGDSMLGAVTMTTDYTGRMAPLPKWVDQGAIIGIQGGENKVKKVIDQALDADCPIVGVWLQDWSGSRQQLSPTGVNVSRLWWNWESDEDLYPEWNSFVQSLRDDHDIRTLSYINTFLANLTTKADGYKRDLFSEASKSNYFIQNLTTGGPSIFESGPGLDAGIIDLTNHETLDWFGDILRDQLWNANISGYMCDFGEYTPFSSDTGLRNATVDPPVYHNRYPFQWASFQDSVISSIPHASSDALVFYRSASMGSAGHMNLFWAGDQDTTWGRNDGLPSVPTILGHMGICGFAHSHSDIGGYTTTFEIPSSDNPDGAVGRTAELLGRWSELAAVSSAVFRSHEGNVPQVNAQPYTSDTSLAWFSHSARLFRALAPYRRRVLDDECAKKGWPLLRMPVLLHPEDRAARNISSESFYLGPDLYVAPVLKQDSFEVDVYFPGDKTNTYAHVWSGDLYHGGQMATVKAPYGQPPLFLVDSADADDLDELLDFVKQVKGAKITFQL